MVIFADTYYIYCSGSLLCLLLLLETRKRTGMNGYRTWWERSEENDMEKTAKVSTREFHKALT